MQLSSLFLTLLLVTFVTARPTPAHECVRQRSCHSHDFELSGAPDLDQEVTLSFAVKLNNVARIHEIVADVSYPDSPNYGKHWSFDEMGELTANPEGTHTVVQYLLQFVSQEQLDITPYGGFVRATTTLKVAQQIVGDKYHEFTSPSTGRKVIRTFQFELPEDVLSVIDYVFPTIQFPPTTGGIPFVTTSAPQAASITPAKLNSYYNITNNVVSNSKATQSLFEALGQSFSPDDLATFQARYGIPSDPLDTVIGPNSPDACAKNPNNCAEANLDVQYMMAIAQKSPTTYWSEPRSLGDIFYKWIEEVASYANPPLVHSISYGSIEDELGTSTQFRFNDEAAKLGAQGVTIVVSSGDDGVANFGARSDASQCGFHPSYPATASYVVAVGATKGPESNQPEVACQSDNGGIITTGGGFSTTFDAPSYQTKEIATFQSNSSACPPKNLFASGGRGYPDVSMAGYNYEVVIGGSVYQVSGTSASAPVFAGVLTLVNNQRLSKGKSAVGWANPALYSLFESSPSVYNDVTSGDNKCCAQSGVKPVCCTYGFYCTKGWDPVTGLGSVNVGRFVDKMVAL